MSLNTFTPEIWAGGVLSAAEKALVYVQLMSRDYEGEVTAFGDRVRINSVGDPTISSYTKDSDINTPEALVGADQVLTVDQAKYFNFAVDDIDQVQNRPNAMAEATRRAGYKLADTIDQFVAGLYLQIDATNTVGSDGSPVTPTANTAGTAMYEYIVDMGTKLNKANCPKAGRFMVITPDEYALLQKDNRFVANGTPGNLEIAENAALGRVGGFDIYVSNNVQKSGSNYKVIAGVSDAWNFVGQITEMKAYQPEKRFGDALKGLMVYGAKVTRPSYLALMTSTL